eukprot:4773562-Amphidinium_carterae.1
MAVVEHYKLERFVSSPRQTLRLQMTETHLQRKVESPPSEISLTTSYCTGRTCCNCDHNKVTVACCDNMQP